MEAIYYSTYPNAQPTIASFYRLGNWEDPHAAAIEQHNVERIALGFATSMHGLTMVTSRLLRALMFNPVSILRGDLERRKGRRVRGGELIESKSELHFHFPSCIAVC